MLIWFVVILAFFFAHFIVCSYKASLKWYREKRELLPNQDHKKFYK